MIFQFNGDTINLTEMVEFEFIVKLGTEVIQHEHQQLPYIMAVPHCQQLVTQVVNDERPIQIIFIRKEWLDMSKYEQEDMLAEKTVVFSNNSYISAFPQEF